MLRIANLPPIHGFMNGKKQRNCNRVKMANFQGSLQKTAEGGQFGQRVW